MNGGRCYNQMLPKEQEEISSHFSNGKAAMPGVAGSFRSVWPWLSYFSSTPADT